MSAGSPKDQVEAWIECAAKAGHPCVYTSGNNIHRVGAGGKYVENVPGQPMQVVHHGRPR